MLNQAPGRRWAAVEPVSLDRMSIVRAVLLGVLLAASISAILLIDFLPANQVILEPNEVSSLTILAPYDLTYESEILSKQARDAQAASVQDIFDPPDASVARKQEVRARQILDYISTVRQDPYASPEQQAEWIAVIPDLELSPQVIEIILALDEEEWQEVKDETVRVLVRAMQGEIKESQVAAIRRSLPTLISLSMTGEQATVVEAIAGELVTANTFYNAARTDEAKQLAREST